MDITMINTKNKATITSTRRTTTNPTKHQSVPEEDSPQGPIDFYCVDLSRCVYIYNNLIYKNNNVSILDVSTSSTLARGGGGVST